jgi:hypothetical protein
MAKRGLRITFWILAGILLVLLADLAIPRRPFRFLGAFGFERGPVSSHSPDVASYRVNADWFAVVNSARTELEAGGFQEVPGGERTTFRRGTGEAAITVYLARDATTAESRRRSQFQRAPGRVAVFVDGIDQRPLVAKLLDLFGP